MEGRGGEEGWVATGSRVINLPCQEKEVRTLALHSKSWISSLRKINEGNELKIIFLSLYSLRSVAAFWQREIVDLKVVKISR